jgi:hypothetical protein
LHTTAIIYRGGMSMYAPYEDPIVKRKHDAQKMILKKAGGKLSEY